ncbi:MAG: transposase [Nitrosotalea sp.]
MGVWLQAVPVMLAGKLVVPLSVYISTANVYDNPEYQSLAEHLPGTMQYVVADAGYDDHKLYDYSCVVIAVESSSSW